jgi:DNA-directed RNA polymerase specialized sigma24 family protein
VIQMQTVTTTAANTPAYATGARPGNEHFANDASYESVRRLLHRTAQKCFARVSALGLGMTFDDVLQEMNLSYVLARDAWNPEAGVRFTTYVVTCCYRNFNNRIAKPERERRELGMVNLTDMRPRGSHSADDDEQDLMEVYGQDTTEVEIPMDQFCMELGEGAGNTEQEEHIYGDPQKIVERKQNAVSNLRSIAELTPVSRDYVVALIRAARNGDDLPTIRELGQQRNLTPSAMTRMRQEIARKFGLK